MRSMQRAKFRVAKPIIVCDREYPPRIVFRVQQRYMFFWWRSLCNFRALSVATVHKDKLNAAYNPL